MPVTLAGGNDVFDGGAGTDTIVFNANRANFTIQKTDAAFMVSDNVSGEGFDTLASVERLQFDDTHIALDTGGQAYRLYQASFNRTPDIAGLGWQMKALDSGVSFPQLSGNFMASTEFKSLYGDNPSDTALVNLFYNNVLHRTPQQFETDFWVNIIGTGQQTRSEVLMSFSESAENQAQVIGTIQNGFEYTYYA